MKHLRLLGVGLLLATLLLSCELPVVSSTPGKNNPPESSPTLPGEGASLTYVSSLADTELVSVTNVGANAKDLVLYAGLYSSTASERVERKSWSIPANGAAVAIKAADIDHLNLWIVPTGGYLSRLTDAGTLCVMKPTAGNQWALVFDGTYASYYSWNMTGTDKTLGYDWTLPGISDDRTVSTAHQERGGLVSGPAVRLINSPQWQLDGDGAHLVNQGQSYYGSNYYYGTIRLKYTGTTPLYFVKVTMRLRNADNSKRFFEYTYNAGSTVKASTYETSTAVLANGELARFALIDNLVLFGMTFADVTAIDLFVEASPLAAGFTQPAGLTIGAPVWTDATNGYTPITNNNPGPLTSYMGEVFFADSQNLEYYFTFPSVYVQDPSTLQWNYWSSPYTLPAGEKARLTFSVNTSDASETFSVARMTQEWSGRSLIAQEGGGIVSLSSDPQGQAHRVEDELRSRFQREEVTAATVAPRPRALEDGSIDYRP